MTVKSRVLFISYDGLTDPLGSSQIIPYLIRIARSGRDVTVLSFEKGERYQADGAEVRALVTSAHIHWCPLTFTRRPRYIAKAWDLMRMYACALWLALSRGVTVVHCRSYLAAQAGLLIKTIAGARMLFDMRGFWVDERVEGGLWDLSRPGNKVLYGLFKWIETRLLRGSDHVVSLTERACEAIAELSQGPVAPITVIPCCADFKHFSPGGAEDRARERTRLGLAADDLVLCYLGSLGTWYMLPEMLGFFSQLRKAHSNAKFLIITKDWTQAHESQLSDLGLGHLRKDLHITAASRQQIPALLQAADLAISFIRPSFSKTASSPTKFAEVMAMGVPLICNAGVGDMDEQMDELQAGYVIDSFTDTNYALGISRLPEIQRLADGLRERARPTFSLERAGQLYCEIYDTLEGCPRA